MTSPRATSLGLMVLGMLAERPMHPYEMQRVMQWRGKDQVVKVQRGSLYPAVERLARAGLIEPVETAREGKRPERTVYQLTEEGRDTASTWLEDMLADPVNEFPRFPAALAFLPLLEPDAARAQLSRRAMALRRQIAAAEASATQLDDLGLPRLFQIEDEYRLAMLRAESAWVTGVLEDLNAGRLTWDEDKIRAWAAEIESRIGAAPGGGYLEGLPTTRGEGAG